MVKCFPAIASEPVAVQVRVSDVALFAKNDVNGGSSSADVWNFQADVSKSKQQ